MRAQIKVLRQNQSFSGTTEIPNSLKIPLQFQVLHFQLLNIQKRRQGILKFLCDEIEVSPNRNLHQDSILCL